MIEHFVPLKFEAFQQVDKNYGMLFKNENGSINQGDTIVFQQLDLNGQLTGVIKRQVVTSMNKFGKQENMLILNFN